jgi:hypothetical protein
LINRIPDEHPRLFVRPEWMPELRERARGDLKRKYDEVIDICERLLKSPPPTEEPPLYPEEMAYGGAEWKKMWWGNREYVQGTLNGAANLGFAYQIEGNEAYGQLARRILMECAKWDTRGSTGFAYNDEAAMPYNYHFARTYTFIQGLLTEEERQLCREVIQARGQDMYKHLYPAHFWDPYGSHENRAWHFLGELGIVFHDEIPGADEWVWAAANVFMNVYPVWGDEEGGWHEGLFYMNAYLLRFTYWADAMKATFGMNALQDPFFSKLGYFPMYMSPPGTNKPGFGDLAPRIDSQYSVHLVSILAAQSQNPYWQWYVEAHDFPEYRAVEIPQEDGYFGFIRGALPKVNSKPPTDLPSSRLFKGIGQASLNSNLLDGSENIQVAFKSSPFGGISHGYESQNAFLLHAYGEPMFIRSGRRDKWGSPFHRDWMWETKSVNSILINGKGQLNYDPEIGYFNHGERNKGQITEFHTDEDFDWVVGEMADGYPDEILSRFTRRILFCKPDVVIIHDILETNEPSTFQWLLHAPNEMAIHDQSNIRATSSTAECKVSFLWPESLEITQSDEFEPKPLPTVDLTEYHLTASTTEKTQHQEFVTVLRPSRKGSPVNGDASIKETSKGFEVSIPTDIGTLEVKLGTRVKASILDQKGKATARFNSAQSK